MTEAKPSAPASLPIHSRSSATGEPVGGQVDCPHKSWVALGECLECRELSELAFDPATNATFVRCTPASK
jgi:hypothetical protein